jgi:glycosyltransferase involved in cell wall biosynthesis
VRVLMVNSAGDPNVGGAEKHVFDLADGLRLRGHEVSFLHAFPRRDGRSLPDATVLSTSDWRHDPLRRVPKIVEDWLALPTGHLEQVVRAQRPDVVNTHNLLGITTGVWEVCRRLRVPIVHTLHDYRLVCLRATLTKDDGQPCRPRRLLCGLRTKRIMRWGGAVSQLVGVSRYVLDVHRHLFPHAQAHVIRHALVPTATRPLRPPHGSLGRLGYVGLLRVHKGLRQLVAAVPELHRRGVAVSIAGKGPLEAEIASAAETVRGLSFEGFVSGADKEAFFESCDAGIVPSTWDEPAPYAALEWLCAGRPLLASPRGGLTEMVDEFAGATAVEPTPAGIVAAVEELLDEARWHAVVAGTTAIDFAGEVERWVEDYERVYDAALSAATTQASGLLV